MIRIEELKKQINDIETTCLRGKHDWDLDSYAVSDPRSNKHEEYEFCRRCGTGRIKQEKQRAL